MSSTQSTHDGDNEKASTSHIAPDSHRLDGHKPTGYTPQNSRAHFGTMPVTTKEGLSGDHPRPGLSKRTTSFSVKRQSMARTISSLSIYSNFAGERLDGPPTHQYPNHSELTQEEKKKNFMMGEGLEAKYEKSSIADTTEELEELSQPKASFGKAMLMF